MDFTSSKCSCSCLITIFWAEFSIQEKLAMFGEVISVKGGLKQGFNHKQFMKTLASFQRAKSDDSQLLWRVCPVPVYKFTKISRTNRPSKMRSSLNSKWSSLPHGKSLEKYVFAGTLLKVLVSTRILDAKVLVSVLKSILKSFVNLTV